MTNLEDHVRIFHNYADGCPGIIVTAPSSLDDIAGQSTLKCAECGSVVSRISPGVLEQLLELIPDSGVKATE